MGTLKRTNIKFNKETIKRRISVEQIEENEDINQLIEEEIREEERKTHQQKEIEDQSKNAALQLVNEFIENETRSSFKRKVKKSKATGGGKFKKSTTTDTLDSSKSTAESKEKIGEVKKLSTTDSLDSGTNIITSDTTNKVKPKKKKKTTKAKKKAADSVAIDMETEHPSSIEEGELEEIIVTPRAQVGDALHEAIPVTTETKNDAINIKKTTTTAEGKKSKKKKKKAITWEKFEEDENQQNHDNEVEEDKSGKDEKPPQTKNLKSKGGGKKRNKISPTPPPSTIPDHYNNKTNNKGNKLKTKLSKDLVMESFSDDNMLDDQQQPKTTENSCLTIVLMAIFLESELPVAFYKKLVKSHKFKDALRNLNAEERALVLAMMDDMSPSIDCLPNSNGIFIDRFKDRLTVIT